MIKNLTPKQEKFACALVQTGNACEAYRMAYDTSDMTTKTVGRKACELKANPAVMARVSELQEAAAAQAEVTAADVLRIWVEIATADPSELMQLHLLPCPQCYEAEPKPAQQPNPHCTGCHGTGTEQVYITDTRRLRGTAKRLYGGVRRTKYGAELILRNQDAALANIAKYLGMFDKPPEAPSNEAALIEQLNQTDDPVKASQIYQQLMQSCATKNT